MAVSKDVILNLIADISDYKKGMMEVGGITEKQAAAAARKWGDIQTKAMLESIRKSKKAAEQSASHLQAVDKVIQGLGYQTNDIKDLAEGIGMLGGAAGPAAVLVLGATAAVTGLGVAAVAAVTGVVSLVAAGDDLAKRLEYLQGIEGIQIITSEELQSIQSANAAMTALADVAAQVALEFAIEFAPSVETVFFELTRLGIAAVNLADDFTKTYDVLRDFVVGGLDGLIKGTIMAMGPVLSLALSIDKLQSAFTGEVLIEDWSTSLIDSSVAMMEAGLASMDMAAMLGVTDDQVQARVDEAKRKLEEKKQALKDAEDATKSLADAEDKSSNGLAKKIEATKEAEKAARELADAERELAQIAEDASEKGLSDAERLRDVAAERIKRIQELYAITKDLAAAERALAAVRGELALGLAQIQQKEDELAKKQGAANAKEAAEKAKQAMTSVKTAAKAASQEMQKVIDEQKAAIQSLIDNSISLITTVMGAVSASLQEGFNKLDEQRQALTDNYLADIERIESARADARAAGDDNEAKALASQRAQKESAYRAELQRIEREKEAKKRAALAVYIVEKALALTSIALQTAVNIVKAGPLNPIGIAAAVAGGAAAAATVLATPPPSFHVGGMVRAPDEQTIRAKAGEFVLSTTGVRAAGGEDNLRRLNRGEPAGQQPLVVQMVYSHRVFESFISDNLKMGGALGRAVRGGRYTGRSTAKYRKAI